MLISIKEKARKLRKSVVLPDALDDRTLKAACILVDKAIASPILIGNELEIRARAQTCR